MSNNEIITICISAAALVISALLAWNTFRLFKRSEVQTNEASKKDLYDSVRKFQKYTTDKKEDNGSGKMNLEQAVAAMKKSYAVGYEQPNEAELVPAHKLITEMYSQFLFDVQTADCIRAVESEGRLKYKVELNSKTIKDVTPIEEFLDKTRDSLAILRDIANFAQADGTPTNPSSWADLLWIYNVRERNINLKEDFGTEMNSYIDKVFKDVTGFARNFSDAITNAKNTPFENQSDPDESVKEQSLVDKQSNLSIRINEVKPSAEEIKWHKHAISKQISKVVFTYDNDEKLETVSNGKKLKDEITKVRSVVKTGMTKAGKGKTNAKAK